MLDNHQFLGLKERRTNQSSGKTVDETRSGLKRRAKDLHPAVDAC